MFKKKEHNKASEQDKRQEAKSKALNKLAFGEDKRNYVAFDDNARPDVPDLDQMKESPNEQAGPHKGLDEIINAVSMKKGIVPPKDQPNVHKHALDKPGHKKPLKRK